MFRQGRHDSLNIEEQDGEYDAVYTPRGGREDFANVLPHF
jgi:hypothetical protein